jgi:hypothetical protein
MPFEAARNRSESTLTGLDVFGKSPRASQRNLGLPSSPIFVKSMPDTVAYSFAVNTMPEAKAADGPTSPCRQLLLHSILPLAGS